ncbi:MAG: T9SS type A sorting domain-containing protein [Chitinophagaceae bacterium]|nr:T9SS type A sorting domain-containing protein [Chitinophagaceae bacterium]
MSSTGVVTGVSGGTATITYKNTNGCTQTASFLVNPLPTISGTPYACVGLSSTLTGSASPATTSPWVSSNTSVASVSSTGVVSAIMAGTTNITFTNSNGCSQSITFTVNPNPLAPVVASPLNLCIGSIAVPLSATGTSLKWYLVPIGGVASSSAPIPSTAVVKDSNFYVSQSNTFGCEGPRATLTVSVKALPLVNITSLSASGFVFCRYSSITLKANTTATAYQWSYNGTLKLGAIADTLIADTTGYYRVNVTDVYGCKNKDSVWVLRDSSVVPVLSPTSAHICLEGEQLFTVSPGYVGWSFNWLQSGVPVLPPTPTSNVRSLSAAGTYWVITTNTLGCFDTTNTSSIVNFSMPAKPTIINKAPLLEVANIYRYYQWFRNGVKLIGANVFRYTTTTSGKYYVEVTDGNGCLNNSDTVMIQPSTKISNTAIKETLKIYPNPTNSKVFIDAPINVNVKVTDITGRLVLDAKEVQEIDLSRFADGSYLFLITDAENNIITVEKIDKID